MPGTRRAPPSEPPGARPLTLACAYVRYALASLASVAFADLIVDGGHNQPPGLRRRARRRGPPDDRPLRTGR